MLCNHKLCASQTHLISRVIYIESRSLPHSNSLRSSFLSLSSAHSLSLSLTHSHRSFLPRSFRLSRSCFPSHADQGAPFFPPREERRPLYVAQSSRVLAERFRQLEFRESAWILLGSRTVNVSNSITPEFLTNVIDTFYVRLGHCQVPLRGRPPCRGEGALLFRKLPWALSRACSR